MRAYEFVLPEHVADRSFEAALAREFGGFTRWQAEGAWSGPSGLEFEKVTVFRVALTWRGILNRQEDMLFKLVMAQARIAGEKVIYYGPPGRPAIYSTGN